MNQQGLAKIRTRILAALPQRFKAKIPWVEEHLELAPLEATLGYKFRDRAVLLQALQHSSYVNEQHDFAMENNERLEFLGDAVLDLVITHILMVRFPETREGDMTRMRAAIVKEAQLAAVAKTLNLGRHILLGKGETLSRGRRKSSILANTLEAVIAAVYLDGDLQAAFRVIEKHFSQIIPVVAEKPAAEDYKSTLQEAVQVRFKSVPRYRVVGETGPDHNKVFEVELKVDNLLTTRGTGKSKKIAEQAAACVALEELKGEESRGG